MSSLHDIGEFGLIRRLTGRLRRHPMDLEGIGDDAAVFRFGSSVLLFSSDASIEGVHFDFGLATPLDIGWKVAAAAWSDIAAMGGRPVTALVSMALPADLSVEVADDLFRGICDMTEGVGASIGGGDTTRSQQGVVIDLAVIGEAPEGRYLCRSGVQPGDIIAVTGWPGRSAAGLRALQSQVNAQNLIEAHLHPAPRFEAGMWLARCAEVHAMMDLSDGLLQDTGHMGKQSRLHIEIAPEAIPMHPEIELFSTQLGIDPRQVALSGGEDFELICAVAPDAFDTLRSAFESQFELLLSAVGVARPGVPGASAVGHPSNAAGYDHFRP